METQLYTIPQCNIIVSSYPTYEEWKPLSWKHKGYLYFSSYPTYEEWKLARFHYTGIIYNSSYPTYEEWKQEVLQMMRTFKVTVLILPMRNKKQRDAHIARLYNLKINNGYNMFL